jgi:hypothetical protein
VFHLLLYVVVKFMIKVEMYLWKTKKGCTFFVVLLRFGFVPGCCKHVIRFDHWWELITCQLSGAENLVDTECPDKRASGCVSGCWKYVMGMLRPRSRWQMRLMIVNERSLHGTNGAFPDPLTCLGDQCEFVFPASSACDWDALRPLRNARLMTR